MRRHCTGGGEAFHGLDALEIMKEGFIRGNAGNNC